MITLKNRLQDIAIPAVALLAALAAAPALAGQAAPAPEDGFCIVNGSGKQAFFAVETREGERAFRALGPGERLCSASTAAKDGIVSVFESDDGFEGCSHIVARGSAVDMLEYAEFDRCRWSDS